MSLGVGIGLTVAGLVSLVIALAGLLLSLINTYWNFFRQAKVFSWVTQLTYMRISLQAHQTLAREMAIDEIQATLETPALAALLKEFSHIREAVASGERSRITKALTASHLTHVAYIPSDQSIDRYAREGRFSVAFFVTLTVTNSGGRFAHIRDLVMIMEPSIGTRLVYAAYMLVKMPDAIDPRKNNVDMDRLNGFFTGISIGPGETRTIDLQFIPRGEAKIQAGPHTVTILGYDAAARDEKRHMAFKTKPLSYYFPIDGYKRIFNGEEGSYFVEVEADVKDARSRDVS